MRFMRIKRTIKDPKRIAGIIAAMLLLVSASSCAPGGSGAQQDSPNASQTTEQRVQQEQESGVPQTVQQDQETGAQQISQPPDENKGETEGGQLSGSEFDFATYRTGDDPLCMELAGSSCEIKSDGIVISCQWADGRTEEIHQIQLDGFASLYFFPAKVEGLESPVLVVSDLSGVFWGNISIYRYDEAGGKWENLLINSRNVPPQFGEYISRPVICANPRCNQDGYLELAESADIGFSNRLFLVHHVVYDEEENCIQLDRHALYESDAGIPNWWWEGGTAPEPKQVYEPH